MKNFIIGVIINFNVLSNYCINYNSISNNLGPSYYSQVQKTKIRNKTRKFETCVKLLNS